MILDGAIDFFAEHGLDGSTHALAKYLNVTQPLIYQYFPNKEELIDAVYEELFRGRWRAEGVMNAPVNVRVLERLQDWVAAGYVVPATAGENTVYGSRTAVLAWAGSWRRPPSRPAAAR